MESLIVHTDGGSRGNPGPAAYGFVIHKPNGELLIEKGERLGIQTNNYAEYMAVISALRWIQEHISPLPHRIDFQLDSQLIERQMKGIYRIKVESIRSLYFTVQQLISALGSEVTFTHVPREHNKQADAMVNRALDSSE